MVEREKVFTKIAFRNKTQKKRTSKKSSLSGIVAPDKDDP
jgi:hypothetical protein